MSKTVKKSSSLPGRGHSGAGFQIVHKTNNWARASTITDASSTTELCGDFFQEMWRQTQDLLTKVGLMKHHIYIGRDPIHRNHDLVRLFLFLAKRARARWRKKEHLAATRRQEERDMLLRVYGVDAVMMENGLAGRNPAAALHIKLHVIHVVIAIKSTTTW